ncbi:MAG: sel1 repeat family protein [Candidatus Thiothrix singaporensis]|uniref:Sel1 repeat family protein n=1 Tax=Candidatus Thiothrix singaporensis TaxID=2799669 RepID=A0A7L6AUD2_9GAMM|nr:MAG: sel1 repeat family protein [Candidatus Thiothrix singaporensis]
MFDIKSMIFLSLLGSIATTPVIASELSDAKAAYDAAFERYTKLVTTDAGTGDVLQALEDYKQAHIHYMSLRNNSGQQTTSKPATLDTSGIEGIESIETTPDDAPIAAATSASDKLTSLTQQAEAGNAQAADTLAIAYQTGYAGQNDPYRAIELLQQAAKAGDANAMAALADEYDSGLWIKQDKNKANTLRKQAAKQGSRLAEWELASHE